MGVVRDLAVKAESAAIVLPVLNILELPVESYTVLRYTVGGVLSRHEAWQQSGPAGLRWLWSEVSCAFPKSCFLSGTLHWRRILTADLGISSYQLLP